MTISINIKYIKHGIDSIITSYGMIRSGTERSEEERGGAKRIERSGAYTENEHNNCFYLFRYTLTI